jgi:WD40 repeat protein
VLLTSRERPAKLEQWAEDLPWVRSLRLAGLDHTAGGALLDARGLAGQAEAITLVNRYSGNPLALKLVAHTIHELFGGAIGDFLRTETPIFDDIRAVLDQQFARLTALEAELLVWLAIVREPISRDDLRQNLVQTPPTAPFLAALRALQRRSLLEVTAGGFTLQNVVTEYVTARLVAQVVAELVEADTMTERVPSGREVAWSPPHLVTQPWLNRYPLLQAQAKEYVRQSQARLIVQPVAEQLAALGTQRLPQRFHTYLADLRATQPHAPGYAAGNLLNLLRALRLELTGYDFSRLCVWQADLRGVAAAPLNLAAADLAHSAFTLNFTTYAVRFNSAGQVLIAGVASSKVSVWVAEQGQLHAAFHSPSHGAYPIVFSDDGRILAAGSLDYRIQLWSAETGDPLHRLLEHEAKITALLIHTRSQTVVSSSVDGMVCLWDLASGRLRHTLHGHTSEVGALALTPEGTLLASGSVDGTIRLWNPHTGQYLAQLTGQQGSISALSFLADGHWLAGGSDAGTLYWWDVVTAHNAASVNPTIPCLGQAQRHASRIRVLAFHREGNLLASGSSDRTIGLWRISASAELVVGNAEHRVDAVTPLALLPVSNDGATPSHSPTPTGEESVPTPHAGRVRAGLTITPIHTLIGHTYEVASVAFAADGTRLVSGGAERMVRLWETAAGQPLGVLHGHATVLHSVRFSPNGALIASGGADGIVRLWDGRAANPTILRHCEGHTAQIFTLAFHPAGTLLASGSGDQTIRLWDVPTGQRVATLPGHAHYVLSVAFSSDGRWLASGSADGTVRLWSLAQIGLPTGGGAAQPAAMLRLSETGGVFCVVFSPDGRTLFCSCLNQLYSVPVSDLAATLRTLEHDELPPSIIPLLGHTGRINRVDISPDGARVASISMDHTLRLWDARTGQALAVRSGQGMGNSAVAFDPTGCWFAYNVEELAIAIADAHTLEVVQILRGHVSTILSLHFSPAQPQENPRLVSCGWDGTIRLWDIERGVCLQTWLIPGPYAGMNIRNATGISPAQQAALVALGATA